MGAHFFPIECSNSSTHESAHGGADVCTEQCAYLGTKHSPECYSKLCSFESAHQGSIDNSNLCSITDSYKCAV